MFLNRPTRRPRPLVVILILIFLASVLLLYTKDTFVPPAIPGFQTNIKNLVAYSKLSNDKRSSLTGAGADAKLAWILHFNYEPNPEVVKILLHFYGKHFVFIAIVSPTGRIGKLVNLNTTEIDAQVVWSPPCPNYLRKAVAGLMMICYSKGLKLLQASSKFTQVDYIVLSNDDVILNMTKVHEFASDGLPVSHVSQPKNRPLIFQPPGPKGTYFTDWAWGEWWPECQKLFSKVPKEYKDRFLRRHGDRAYRGAVDVILMPKQSVPEFIFLSSIVGECWIEMNIPNALAMLTEPVRFYSYDTQLLMYYWPHLGVRVSPNEFEQAILGKQIMSFHPFKLSYPKHRAAFIEFIANYKLN